MDCVSCDVRLVFSPSSSNILLVKPNQHHSLCVRSISSFYCHKAGASDPSLLLHRFHPTVTHLQYTHPEKTRVSRSSPPPPTAFQLFSANRFKGNLSSPHFFLFVFLRAADLLPVVLLVGIDAGRTIGLMLNRRTGVLMGDLGDDFRSFMIQVRSGPFRRRTCVTSRSSDFVLFHARCSLFRARSAGIIAHDVARCGWTKGIENEVHLHESAVTPT